MRSCSTLERWQGLVDTVSASVSALGYCGIRRGWTPAELGLRGDRVGCQQGPSSSGGWAGTAHLSCYTAMLKDASCSRSFSLAYPIVTKFSTIFCLDVNDS